MDLDTLLGRLLEANGTDLYVTVGSRPKMSVDGAFRDAANEVVTSETAESLLYPLIPDRAAFDVDPERDFALSVGEHGRFRVNLFKQRGECAMVVRRIRTKIQSLGELGLPDVARDMALARKGLVLVTGATGSGKSTTLAAMIDHRNANRDGHIITIEDPIEFLHAHKRSVVSQREVGIDTKSFERALRSALRQAPDVLLVGEIRDRETAEAAVHFAETGHLVLATLHSTNTNQTLERLTSLFPPDRREELHLLLSLNVRGILSQRLVPANEGGRAAVLEILLPTARVRELLKRGALDEIRTALQQGEGEGMCTFDQSLHRLYTSGVISLENALAYADSPGDLRLKVSLSKPAETQPEIRVV